MFAPRHPLTRRPGALQRSLSWVAALAALALLVAACGGDDNGSDGAAATAPQARDEAAVLVTRDCGNEVVVEKTNVPAGQTAMQGLDRVAEIETDSGGKFVTAINGLEQNENEKFAWLFYVNGAAAQKGATEIRLKAGDVEWWDYHRWTKECTVPAAAR